uniref:Cytochrome b n=1 Tax=Baltalimania ylvae TaxID=3341436 RepID=A0A1X9WD95_9BILA|nr:cytochrome b [Archaphanostoma ylvae]ARS00897.1 cytochrome b [Archaphanostoma ylvae]
MSKHHPLLKIVSGSLVYLPSPININYFWNWGSMLGVLLIFQIVSGLLLASHYSSELSSAFNSIDHIMRDVNWGWLIRILHLNTASFFFLGLFIHIGRGLYHGSFFLSETWNLGVVIFFLSVITAFVGYVLPWGQMSFWGATVITNLLSALPIIGSNLVNFVWGGFAVGAPTLSRFFMLHFCFPFILMGLIILHLFFLHASGSSNPLNFSSKINLIAFHWFFSSKDFWFFFLFFSLGEIFIFLFPFLLGDPENFILANPMSTPTHIVPEWYFLFAYAILRSIPNKLLGVIFLGLSILILFLPPLLSNARGTLAFHVGKQYWFFIFIGIFLILTWLGGQVVEAPFIFLGQCFLVLYFVAFFLIL